MQSMDPYLIFDGNCGEAMSFYEQTLGGTMETFMTVKESPAAAHCPPGTGDQIMHACLLFDGDRRLMASDSLGNGKHEGMKGFSVAIAYPDVRKAEQVFAALTSGGSVHMPMGKTFWAESFGMGVDRFGTPWFVSGGLKPGARDDIW